MTKDCAYGMISFGLIKVKHCPSVLDRSGEPHIDNETVSIAPRFKTRPPATVQ